MRSLSEGMLSALNAQSTDNAILALVTISHNEVGTIRIVNNTEAVVSNGETYQPYMFDLVLGDDTANGIKEAKLMIDNVNREITRRVRLMGDAASVNIKIVLSQTPDVVEIELDGLKLRNVEYNENWIGGTLSFEERLMNNVPVHTFSPLLFEGLFR